MLHPPQPAPLSSLRDDAQILIEESLLHWHAVEAAAAAAERDMKAAEAELASALVCAHSPIDHVRGNMLRMQLQRSTDVAQVARGLVDGARDQHGAAERLLARLDEEQSRTRTAAARAERNGVLVVDDYEDIRNLVATLLQSAGFVVRTAHNGLEALIVANEMRPAVIVMDVTMPVLDGVRATRLIKANDATRHARVIAYTGNPMVGESHVGELFVAVMHKPATPAVVIETVRRVAALH